MNQNKSKLIRINVKEMLAKGEFKPMLVFNGQAPIDVEEARNYFTQRAKFFLQRLERSLNRPNPPLYDKNGAISFDMKRFKDDINALLTRQQYRAAIETAMSTDQPVILAEGETFQKVTDQTILINLN